MRRINKPSDDPVGSSTALRYRAYESDQASYSQSADDAITRLSGSDTALQDMSGALRKVRELAISATNTSLSPEAREAIGAEVDALRGELATLANSSHGGQALFGGHATTAVTRAEDGTWSYSGDDGQVQRRVAQGTVLAVNIDGRAAFGFDQPPGEDLLSVVDRLAAATRSGDLAALGAGQTALADRTTRGTACAGEHRRQGQRRRGGPGARRAVRRARHRRAQRDRGHRPGRGDPAAHRCPDRLPGRPGRRREGRHALARRLPALSPVPDRQTRRCTTRSDHSRTRSAAR